MHNILLDQPTSNWIAVASADHARRGRDARTDLGNGFMRQRWGYKFRFGLFKINDHDMQLIAHAMQVPLKLLQF
jgi:hypothetical protein